MTDLEVLKLIRDEIGRARSASELGRRWGVSQSYMSNLMNFRKPPGPKILEALGLEKVVTIDYRPKANGRKR